MISVRHKLPRILVAAVLLLLQAGLKLAHSVEHSGRVQAQYSQAIGRPALTPDRKAFEVVSIAPSKRSLFWESPQMETTATQPNGYRAVNQPMTSTIQFAYLPITYMWTADSAPLNLPNWTHEQYDIQAKVSQGDLAEWQKQGLGKEMLSAMLRTMLEERCKIVVHWLEGQTSGYALVLGKQGAKLKKAGEPVPPKGLPVLLGRVAVPGATFFPSRQGDVPFYHVSMAVMTEWLSNSARTPILDRTGLTGDYDVVLHRRNDLSEDAETDAGPWISWDLDSLGLKLIRAKVPTKRLVIDHIERPSPN